MYGRGTELGRMQGPGGVHGVAGELASGVNTAGDGGRRWRGMKWSKTWEVWSGIQRVGKCGYGKTTYSQGTEWEGNKGWRKTKGRKWQRIQVRQRKTGCLYGDNNRYK